MMAKQKPNTLTFCGARQEAVCLQLRIVNRRVKYGATSTNGHNDPYLIAHASILYSCVNHNLFSIFSKLFSWAHYETVLLTV